MIKSFLKEFKNIFLVALSFWIFGYTISLLILFLQLKFEVVWAGDNFFTLFSRPLFFTLWWVYSPLYIFPLLLGKYQKSILSIILSFLIAFPHFFILAMGATENTTCRILLIAFVIAFVMQTLFCLGIYLLFNRGKEKIIPTLIKVSLLLFFIVSGYIAFAANVASKAELILGELLQEAIKTKDFSFCEKILEESKKRYASEFRIGSVVGNNYIKCVQAIAVETKNIELCRKIEIAFEDCKCIGMIAAATNNPDLCYQEVTLKKKIYDGDLYTKACLEAYHSAKSSIEKSKNIP